MNQASDSVKTFFEDFARANNMFDQELLASTVTDPLVGAYSNGDVLALKKEDYLAGRPEAWEYVRSLGFQFLTIAALEETRLGNNYTLVKTRGTMRLEKVPGQPIDLVHDTSYILFIKDGVSKIVFSITHDDLMKMAQEQGLLPVDSRT